MGKRYVSADPTANAALGRGSTGYRRVDNGGTPKTRPRRRIVEEFPDLFAGLTDGEVKLVAVGAAGLAGGDVWAITRDHLLRARQNVAPQAS